MTSALVCLATLLSHTASLGSASPLSDVPYFGVAMTCLLVLSLAASRSGWPRYALLGLALALAAGGVSIRIAGIALVPPILFVAFGEPALRVLRRTLKGRRVVGALVGVGLLVLLAAVAVLVVRASPYSRDVAYAWRLDGGFHAAAGRWGNQAGLKFVSVGELATQTTCCHRVSPAFKPVLVVAGAAALALVGLGLIARRRLGFVDVFLLSTAAVIVVYAGGQARFWLSALPFLLAYGLLGAKRLARWKPLKLALLLYAVAFTAAGGAWLADSIRLSTAGAEFPRLWARKVGPPLAASYRIAYGQADRGDDRRASPLALELLRRYVPPPRGQRPR
jgi:hypothetical protein